MLGGVRRQLKCTAAFKKDQKVTARSSRLGYLTRASLRFTRASSQAHEVFGRRYVIPTMRGTPGRVETPMAELRP